MGEKRKEVVRERKKYHKKREREKGEKGVKKRENGEHCRVILRGRSEERK